MRVSATILGFLAATSLTLSPVFAQGRGGGSAKPPVVKPTTSGKPAASTAPRSTGKPTTSGKPVATTTRSTGKPTTSGKPVATTTRSTGKPTTSGKPVATTTRSTGKPTTSGKPDATTTRSTGKPVTVSNQPKSTSGKPTATAAKVTKSGSPSTTVSGSTVTPLNPIAAKIASKPNLSAKLTRMLPIDPVTGRTMTLDTASLGFKNQGQFIAALHVSQNLGIPFAELKSHMVTVTPGVAGQPPTATQTGSLGQAIQASKTTANVTTAVERAEAQAAADLQTANSPPTSTTSGSAVPKNKKTTTGRGR